MSYLLAAFERTTITLCVPDGRWYNGRWYLHIRTMVDGHVFQMVDGTGPQSKIIAGPIRKAITGKAVPICKLLLLKKLKMMIFQQFQILY